MRANVIRCSHCQRAYSSLDAFVRVRSLGLALKGLCRCGAWLSVGELWHAKQPEQLVRQQERQRAPVSAAQRISLDAGSQMPQKAPERL